MLNRIFVKYFINTAYPKLKADQTVAYAITCMEEWQIKHLPIVEKENYKALVAEEDLLQFPAETLIKEIINETHPPISIYENTHIFEAYRVAAQYRLSLLPVISPKNTFKGVLTQETLFFALGELLPVNEEYSLIILEMPQRDQNLSALVHLIEANNAHILCYTTQILGRGENILVFIMIDLSDPSNVMMSLERFNYKIIYHSAKYTKKDWATIDRWEELMRYMNI